MTFPKRRDIEIPLLRVIDDFGGQSEPQKIYPRVAKFFPELTPVEQEQRMEGSSNVKWWNQVQWVRERLKGLGQIDGSTHRIWKITDAGRARLRAEGQSLPTCPEVILDKSSPIEQESPPVPLEQRGTQTEKLQPAEMSLADLANTSIDEVKARLISELKNLTPRAFEHFCVEFLRRLGYRNVTVTRAVGDGGIDGFGDFRQGAVQIKSAFQAKRWSDAAVGRPEVDKFRGAIQGEYDHGVFLTTSGFSQAARDASVKKGAITILLIDGPSIVDLMIEWNIGVIRQPVYLHEIDSAFFQFEER